MSALEHRDALFLRALELLKDFVSFGFDTGERERIRTGALEIIPGMEHEARTIHEEPAP